MRKIEIGLCVLIAAALGGIGYGSLAAPSRQPTAQVERAAPAEPQSTERTAARPAAFAVPEIDWRKGEPWPGEWLEYPPDEALPAGVRIEVTGGVVTGVTTGDRTAPNPDVLGSRYVVGDVDATDVTPALCRSVSLTMSKPDGGKAELKLIRPLWWLELTGAVPGGTIDLGLHEIGVSGEAEVHAIGPCDGDSRTAPPGYNVTTGTITHRDAVVWDLTFKGPDGGAETVGVTANHPIWSADRLDWIPAGDLAIGERADCEGGVATLTGKTRRPGRHTVYNLEVHRSHAYRVSQFGILAHNATGVGCGPSARVIHDKFLTYVRPGAREKVFDTPWTSSTGLGTRKFDDWDRLTGTGFEANTTPWSRMTIEQLQRKLDQVGSDYTLLKTDPTVKRIVWFGTEELPASGLGGQLREALRQSGIEYWTIPW